MYIGIQVESIIIGRF